MTTQPEPDLRSEIAAARELVMELTRRAGSGGGFGGETHTHLGRACQLLLSAEDSLSVPANDAATACVALLHPIAPGKTSCPCGAESLQPLTKEREMSETTPQTDADICRENGWTVGTQLVGDEGYGPSEIRITAIGERNILAIRTAPRLESEALWTLSCRDWRKVEAEEPTPQAEPASILEASLTAMREVMTPDQSGPHIISRVAVSTAVRIAEEHMRELAASLLARISELECERDEAAGHATRLARLLAAPLPVADEYASLKDQLKFDVHTAFANQLLTDAQLFEDAKHWQTGAASRLLDAIEPEIDRYIAAMLRDKTAPSPEVEEVVEVPQADPGHQHRKWIADSLYRRLDAVLLQVRLLTEAVDRAGISKAPGPQIEGDDDAAQELPGCQCDATECPVHADTRGEGAPLVEVPAGEAHEGDTVTIVGTVASTLGGRLAVAYGQGSLISLPIDGDGWTVSRPTVSPPTEPGAVIRCRIKGLDGVRVAELELGSRGWITTGIDDAYWPESLELVEVLYLPSAGLSEGGLR